MEGCIRLIWKCNYCNDVVISYSAIKHDMNTCDCGMSFVDLEEYYMRVTGDIKEISKKIFKNKTWIKMEEENTEKWIYIIRIEFTTQGGETATYYDRLVDGTDEAAKGMIIKAAQDIKQQAASINFVSYYKVDEENVFDIQNLNETLASIEKRGRYLTAKGIYMELRDEFEPIPTPEKKEEAENPLSE